MSPSRRCNRLVPRAPWLAIVVVTLALAGCRRESSPGELPGASSEPAGAVRQLAYHLQHNDLQAFARDALPAAERAQLAEAWAQGRSRWPLTELPLDEQLGPALAILSAPGAEKRLQRSFERQMAGQDRALRDAARSLALFGTQYVRTQGRIQRGRAHPLRAGHRRPGAWSTTAPLGDRKRAAAAIDRLAAAARDSGLDGDPALTAAGMDESLRRLGPVAATIKTVLEEYGLDLDGSLTRPAYRSGRGEGRPCHRAPPLHAGRHRNRHHRRPDPARGALVPHRLPNTPPHSLPRPRRRLPPWCPACRPRQPRRPRTTRPLRDNPVHA
ncbi:hypothetical protein H1235_00980 [Pseudoxanthomonas sp. NC8]|nr:hypothetical protein H1235_00980 [Pseudoxanthomonas sp. NC8]